MKRKAKKSAADDPKRMFASQADWAAWLDKNHRTSKGLWLQLAKKGCELPSVSYAEALETALCYGWIDGQKRGESEDIWLQRFLPRTAKSIWSKINREKAKELIKNGQMKPAGLDVVEAAERDGRWDSAYDSMRESVVPKDFEAALKLNSRAQDFFQTLDRANRYAVLFRIQTVKKAETRERKIGEFVEMLARGERIHETRAQNRKSR